MATTHIPTHRPGVSHIATDGLRLQALYSDVVLRSEGIRILGTADGKNMVTYFMRTWGTFIVQFED